MEVHLSFTITTKEKFIYIKWNHKITESSLIDCSNQVSTLPDYPGKNRIYDLREAIVEVSGFRLAALPVTQK